MKIAGPLLLVAGLSLVFNPAQARNVYLETQEGRITLEFKACPERGQVATFSHRHFDVVGFGCWLSDAQVVSIHWTKSLGADGKILHIDGIENLPLPEALRLPASVRSAIETAESLDTRCQGGSGDDDETYRACDQRDVAYAQIEKLGWCWGPSKAVEADKTWLPCE